MSDETTPLDAPPTDTAVAEMPKEEEKLKQTVEVTDAGPCKKHIKVVVDREAIDKRFDEKYTELVRSDTSQVNGFRPGKAPRKIIERRFKSSVEEEVRREVMMASLEQLATENQLSPLAAPELDPKTLEFPESGPFTYEFDIEVRPEFDLPPYRGIKLKRLVKTFGPADIAKERRRLLEPAGQLVPKDGAVELNDYIVADVVMLDGERELNSLKEVRVKIEPELALQDGVAENFGKTLVGAKVGDVRDVAIKIADGLSDQSLRGKTITGRFTVNDVKSMRLPELTGDILSKFGVRNEDQFEELIEAGLNQRLEYMQRQAYRQQILSYIVESSKWDLPHDLLVRQSKAALQRRVMEMRSSGMTDQEILGRKRKLEQDVVQSTAVALREHFVLQKIAELEKIEITEDDIDTEIDRIASRTNDSPRKVRARMEKDELIDTLATELLERQALDLVLQNAEYEDVEIKSEDEEVSVATMTGEAVPGASTTPVEKAPASPTEY